MKLDRRSGTDERRILTAMIVDRTVLGAIASRWTSEGLFSSPWANLVGRWAVRYMSQYGRPPGRDIMAIYESWASRNAGDVATAELVGQFLAGLSREYEAADGINSEYVIDLASTHFNTVRVRSLVTDLRGDIEEGDVDTAIERIARFGRVEVGTGTGIDLLLDENEIMAAFAETAEPLIHYDGALGEFINHALTRDAFVSLMAPPKVGKTFLLLDIAFRAVLQRKKVAFFEVGDMSKAQIIKRFMSRIAQAPIRPRTTVKIPRKISRDENGLVLVTHEEKFFEDGLDWKSAWEACQRFQDKKIRSTASYLKLCVEPNSSINVDGIRANLNIWERDGWVPDVIVIDYADILAPPAGYRDSREQIIATWRQLRALSQSTHSLVITASQSDADSFNTTTLGMRNFTGSMLKLAEATGIIGINMTHHEREQGVVRLNWVVLRENENIPTRCVYVAGSRAIANMCIESSWLYKNEDNSS